MLKPANATPLSAYALCVLAEEAEVPPGVLNCLTGNAGEISGELARNSLVRKISFTGSTEISRTLMAEADKDITLSEIADRFETDRSLRVAPSTIWYFLDRRGITLKKSRTRASSKEPTSCDAGAPGSRASLILIRSGWSSSMRPVPRPRWRAFMAGRHAVNAAGLPFLMGTGRPRPSPAPCVSRA